MIYGTYANDFALDGMTYRSQAAMTTALSAVFFGCGSLGDSHERFKSVMEKDVGKSLGDSNTYRNYYRSQLVATRQLTATIKEEQFHFARRCEVFFRIDSATKTITAWRFEGTTDDCYINP
jgi:hypothetical protein